MTNVSGMLYTGMTNNLEVRVYQHKTKTIPGFTSWYNLTKLVYFESTDDVTAAIAREKQIKGWLRKRKVGLIESINPEWRDLSLDFMDEVMPEVRDSSLHIELQECLNQPPREKA